MRFDPAQLDEAVVSAYLSLKAVLPMKTTFLSVLETEFELDD